MLCQESIPALIRAPRMDVTHMCYILVQAVRPFVTETVTVKALEGSGASGSCDGLEHVYARIIWCVRWAELAACLVCACSCVSHESVGARPLRGHVHPLARALWSVVV